MPEIKNTFLAGKMNKSLDDRLLPEGEYRDALNIQVTKSEGTDVGVIQNIKGNINLTNLNLPEGFEVIGSCFDEQNNVIYWFVTNNETSYVYRYGEEINGGVIPTTTTTTQPPPSTTTTTLISTTTTTIPGQTTTTTIPVTTTEALFTTADITGVDTPVIKDDINIYGATIGGNTTGDITYTWRVTKGEITGGTYDGLLRSVLTGTASEVPNIEVTWGIYETGSGLIELTAVRGGETGTDSDAVNVLPKYYIFNACDGGTTVIDQLSIAPTIDPNTGLGQQYVDLSQQPKKYYSWSGFTQNDSSGYPVVDLQPVTPTTYGCAVTTTTLAPEQITVTGPFIAATAGESGILYNIETVYPTTGWQVTDDALQEFNPIDITLTTSTSGIGDGSIEVTFGAYNGNGTETLRSRIIVTSDNVTPQVAGVIVISQFPPTPTTTTTTTTTTTIPPTTVDITGVTTTVIDGDIDNYGATVGGTTTGDITYTWRVTKGEITGGTYDGSQRSVLTGTAASVPSIEVTWGIYETGEGLIELDIVRGGEPASDSDVINILPIYYVFDACDGGETIISLLGTAPSQLSQQYIDYSVTPKKYYIYNGNTVNSSAGFTVKSLQPASPIVTGCPTTTTLAPEQITVTGQFTAAAAGESDIVYTIDTIYPDTDWIVTDAALQGFNPIDITLTTSTSGTGDGSVTATFGAYNGNGTETLRSQIIVTSINRTPEVSGTITISQGPA